MSFEIFSPLSQHQQSKVIFFQQYLSIRNYFFGKIVTINSIIVQRDYRFLKNQNKKIQILYFGAMTSTLTFQDMISKYISTNSCPKISLHMKFNKNATISIRQVGVVLRFRINLGLKVGLSQNVVDKYSTPTQQTPDNIQSL